MDNQTWINDKQQKHVYILCDVKSLLLFIWSHSKNYKCEICSATRTNQTHNDTLVAMPWNTKSECLKVNHILSTPAAICNNMNIASRFKFPNFNTSSPPFEQLPVTSPRNSDLMAIQTSNASSHVRFPSATALEQLSCLFFVKSWNPSILDGGFNPIETY